MEKYVRMRNVEKEFVSVFLNSGWRIVHYNEEEKKYEIGLPIERAYENYKLLAHKFISAELIEPLIIHTCERYGRDYNDYHLVKANSLSCFNKTSDATHYIDWHDELNVELNQILYMNSATNLKFFAKPIKKE